MGNSDIFNPPQDKQYSKKPFRIIYQELVFREFIILSVCGAGYLLSTTASKKN